MKSFRFPVLVFLLGFYSFLSAQLAKVDVTCIDNGNNPLEGQQVLFKKVNSTTEYKGITNGEGKFSIEIKGPGKYVILAKSLSEVAESGTMILPTLKPGQSYGTYEVEVKIEPPREFTLDNVYYEVGSATLKKESFPELDELFELLSFNKKIVIEIGGHTDNTGSEESNLSLSKNRAESVKKYLVSKGISGERIKTVGYGESQAIADNNTEEGRKINRRTEVRIIGE